MIYTSYFGNMGNIRDRYPNIVFCSVASKTPDWFLDENELNFISRELAPKYSWWSYWKAKFGDDPESKESIEYYTYRYKDTVLDALRGWYIRDMLYENSKGNDVCMLCYEKPDKFCHRHLISKWLGVNKITCGEISVNSMRH